MSNIINVCLTGGPCSGKTTALELLKSLKTINGYNILLIPEAATLLATHGIKPANSEYLYQEAIFDLQIFFRELYENYANKLNQKTLIVHDRGIHDALVYIDKDSYDSFCKNHNFIDTFKNYDCVIHLVSVACDKPELYNVDNEARRENLEEAILTESLTLELSKKCVSNFIVGNDTNSFQDKFEKIIGIINSVIDIKEKAI